jgi:hypothetical protein
MAPRQTFGSLASQLPETDESLAMQTVCAWCEREGHRPDGAAGRAVIVGVCATHATRLFAEVEAALRPSGEVPIGRSPRAEPSDPAGRTVNDVGKRVAKVLDLHGRVDLCDRCVAAAAHCSPREARRAASALAATGRYLRDEWRCGTCGARAIVTRARARQSSTPA